MARKAETIRKEIKLISVAANKLGVRIHKCAGWCLEHYKAHGDTSLCSDLLNSLKGSGIYRKALLEWFKRHGHMEVVRGNEPGQGIVFTKEKGFNHTNVDMAAANGDFFGKKDTDADATKPTLDAFKMLKALLDRDAKGHEHPEEFKEIKSTFSEAQRKVLENLVAAGPQAGMVVN